MRNLFGLLTLSFLLIGISGCTKTDKYPKPVEFFEIHKGDRGQGLRNEYLHITDSITWNKFLIKFDSAREISSHFVEKNIDFGKFDIIAAIDSNRNDAGFDIKITEIFEFERRYEVGIEKRRYGGALITAQPFHIVKTYKLNKPIVYIEK